MQLFTAKFTLKLPEIYHVACMAAKEHMYSVTGDD